MSSINETLDFDNFKNTFSKAAKPLPYHKKSGDSFHCFDDKALRVIFDTITQQSERITKTINTPEAPPRRYSTSSPIDKENQIQIKGIHHYKIDKIRIERNWFEKIIAYFLSRPSSVKIYWMQNAETNQLYACVLSEKLSKYHGGGYKSLAKGIRIYIKDNQWKCSRRAILKEKKTISEDQIQARVATVEKTASIMGKKIHACAKHAKNSEKYHIVTFAKEGSVSVNLIPHLRSPHTLIKEKNRLIIEFFINFMTNLSRIHQENWIHFDLKLENVLVDGQLIDGDGAFKKEEGPPRNSHLLCTTRYRAPETYLNGYTPDTSCDIYSAGLMLTECIYGYASAGIDGHFYPRVPSFYEYCCERHVASENNPQKYPLSASTKKSLNEYIKGKKITEPENLRSLYKEHMTAYKNRVAQLILECEDPTEHKLIKLASSMCHPDPKQRPTAQKVYQNLSEIKALRDKSIDGLMGNI